VTNSIPGCNVAGQGSVALWIVLVSSTVVVGALGSNSPRPDAGRAPCAALAEDLEAVRGEDLALVLHRDEELLVDADVLALGTSKYPLLVDVVD